MDLEFASFVRKPFTVEAVRITKENISDVAEFGIGELKEEDGDPFIEVDSKKVPNVTRVFPGYWLTRMGGKLHCYSNKIFQKQFARDTPEIRQWVDFVNGVTEPQPAGADA